MCLIFAIEVIAKMYTNKAKNIQYLHVTIYFYGVYAGIKWIPIRCQVKKVETYCNG